MVGGIAPLANDDNAGWTGTDQLLNIKFQHQVAKTPHNKGISISKILVRKDENEAEYRFHKSALIRPRDLVEVK